MVRRNVSFRPRSSVTTTSRLARKDEAAEAGQGATNGVVGLDVRSGPTRVQRHGRPTVDTSLDAQDTAVWGDRPPGHEHGSCTALAIARCVEGADERHIGALSRRLVMHGESTLGLRLGW